jgi:gluconate 2-dehydrogenase alpha chain
MRISDFDGDRALTGGEGLLRMGILAANSFGNRPIASFDVMPPGSARKNWGAEWKSAALQWRDRNAAISLSGEHLSYRQNFMDLDPTYTDKYGDPLLRFTLDWTEHEYRQRAFAKEIARKIAAAMGATAEETPPDRSKYNVINYQTTHIQGGAIMGEQRDSSVVNRYLQHWNVPNVWVIGASAFPQNASHNPTLTVLALTYWAADAIIQRYLKHPEALA